MHFDDAIDSFDKNMFFNSKKIINY